MDKKIKLRKKWVRRATIIFFAAMLLLTFFSNTIMNYTLPRVATAVITSDTVTSKVRGTGTIEAGAEKTVTINETRVVESIPVDQGSEVKKGDVLINLTATESEEITSAESELEAAKQSYNQQILTNEIDQSVVTQAENGGVDYESSRSKLASLTANVNQTKEALTAAQTALNNYTGTASNSGNSDSSSDYDGDMDDSADGGSDYYSEASSDPQLNNLQTAVNNAQNAYDEAVSAHDKFMNEINQINELKTSYDAIKTAENNLTKLKAASVGNQITADRDGVVENIMVEAGDTINAGDEVITIAGSENGFKMSISVTQAESKLIKVGDEATINNSWYFGDAKATVASIKNDPSNPGKQKLVNFNLSGDLTAGDSMTVTVGEKSGDFDYVVPNSAIREDKNGKFVLVVTSKSSPLGNRYIAKKVKVEIERSDDQNSAISGPVEEGDYVITTSNKMVESGDYVRLADN